ncbi:hypothetical protein PAA26_00175 [Methanomassiliicoccaceae archaeon COG_1]|nr:hypothetical protein [Methanomassiliicoccaceae archaeon COG_1]
MEWDIWMFITVVLVVFALVMLLAGIFAAGFGSGRSRAYGGIIALVGGIVLIATVYMCSQDVSVFGEFDAWELIRDAIIYLVAILIGALAAVGIFLVSILKS